MPKNISQTMNNDQICIDKYWYNKFLKIHQYKRKIFKSKDARIVIKDKHVEVKSALFNLNKQEKLELLEALEKKQRKLEKLESKILRKPKQKFIHKKYLERIQSEKLDIQIHKAKLLHKDELVDLLDEKYSYSHKDNLAFIAEFASFINYLLHKGRIKNSQYSKQIIDTLVSLFHITHKEIDFDKITQLHEQRLKKINLLPRKTFSSEEVQILIQNLLDAEGINGISVEINENYLFAVLPNLKKIYIPQNLSISSERLIEIIAHEILGHLLRSLSAEKTVSKTGKCLKLLSLGTKDYLLTEEGICTYLEQNIFGESDQYDIYRLFDLYLRVIALEISRVKTPYETYKFIKKLIKLKKEIFPHTTINEHTIIQNLLTRLYADFHTPRIGLSNPKISIYLRGNRTIWPYLTNHEKFTDLFLGKISVNEVYDFKKRGYHQPQTYINKIYPFKRLQMMLYKHVMSFNY
ncbi:MAG: hypothetical protein KatS3mg084_0471 [Candidatus Dojkabacteria bacterium]|nr:MAG: hypothetical protein KatS3mg084_0471 [Candidatus Dojkabacteria bacterium]